MDVPYVPCVRGIGSCGMLVVIGKLAGSVYKNRMDAGATLRGVVYHVE